MGENLCKLEPFQTQEKCFIWDCYDCSDEEPRFTKFCARFRNMEEKKKFQEAFDLARTTNEQAQSGTNTEETKEEAPKEDEGQKTEEVTGGDEGKTEEVSE